MDRAAFFHAFRQLGGRGNESISDLYYDLYHEERRLATLITSVTDPSIAAMQSEIATFEAAIREIKQNNAAHEQCIFGCSHLLGSYVIRKEFGESFEFRSQSNKFKRLCELIDHKVDVLRQKLSEKPRKVRSTKGAKCEYYIRVVQDYLDAEMRLADEKQAAEVNDIDAEASAFALVDEISEYYLAAKGLNLKPPEFNPAEILSGILGCDFDEDLV
jgi:hypothetical protein